MIKVDHLTKRYGHRTAVEDISFEVSRGEVVGFLGPNGAGKTTTMNILTGYISSTSGTVNINGFDVLEEPNKVKKSVGYLPELPPLYLNMTVMEYLNFVYDLKKAGSKARKNKREQIESICDTVKINDVKNRLIANLSKGYRQRVGLAQAMLGDPEVLILDEPTVGLDPQQIIEIRNLIKQLGENHTIILSSHILSEIQAICDRIIIINQGKIIADDTEENLANSLSSSVVYSIRVQAEQEQAEQLLSQLENVQEITCTGTKEEGTVDFSIIPLDDNDIRKDLFELMSRNDMPLLELSGNRPTLERVFLQLLAKDHQEADSDEDTEEFMEDEAETVGDSEPIDELEEGQPVEEDGEKETSNPDDEPEQNGGEQ